MTRQSAWMVFALILTARLGSTHDSRPVYVEIVEAGPAFFQVEWKTPATIPGAAVPSPLLPPDCLPQDEVRIVPARDGHVGRASYRCEATLAGREVQIVYPMLNPSLATLFQVSLENGESHHQVLAPGEETWRIPHESTLWSAVADYTRLGVAHIWGGYDHLLFVACLVFLARSPKRLLWAVTGFTAAHSLTLMLSALGAIRIAVEPVEAVIALSVVFLAAEVARADERSWTWRHPVLSSSAFGLLHGFGFAAALRETGLPGRERLAGLLFFNVGVEIGQLLFVGALVAALFAASALLSREWREWPNALMERCALPVSYTVGVLSVVWFIGRLGG